jgi:hypothetical protein
MAITMRVCSSVRHAALSSADVAGSGQNATLGQSEGKK